MTSLLQARDANCACGHPWAKHGAMGCFASTTRRRGARKSNRRLCSCILPAPPADAARGSPTATPTHRSGKVPAPTSRTTAGSSSRKNDAATPRRLSSSDANPATVASSRGASDAAPPSCAHGPLDASGCVECELYACPRCRKVRPFSDGGDDSTLCDACWDKVTKGARYAVPKRYRWPEDGGPATARPRPRRSSRPRDAAASEVPAAVLMVGVTLTLFALALHVFLPCAFGVCTTAAAYPTPPEGAHWTDCDALDATGCAMLPTETLSLHAGAPTCIRVTKTATTSQTIAGATQTTNGILCAVTGGTP